MKQNYKLSINNLTNNEDVLEYKKLLRCKWDNNVYYSVEHLLHFKKDTEKIMCFLFKKDETAIVLMPVIFREIKFKNKSYPYYDVISPYGYSGPLFCDTVSEEDITCFWKSVDRWYKENNVIAEFIRFSLNDNHKHYSGYLTKSLSNVRGTLLETFEGQWAAFLPKVRNNYRKAVNHNLTFKIFHKEEITKDIIEIFNDIYVDTMNRNKADRIYFFSGAYFENLILSNLDNFSIAIAYYKNIPVSIELIIRCKTTLFAFLGGTNAEYFSYRPNDFLRVKIIEWAIQNKIKYYVLGGGMKDGDGLYKHKKSLFPKDEDAIFYTGRKIINEEAYDELCMSNNKDYSEEHKKNLKDYFFPFYRVKI
ncbi:GNAT family N-acetyltransferase [Aquimarina aquimarini]|uniref:GNAT family N-acetyltransferase n=1 Tax=Aquimarina aquimarini TaxID=1191734 RepID=UPI000D54DDEA|nr:GNAT family N-acetyltransferase [Aquimarina aquimarini]